MGDSRPSADDGCDSDIELVYIEDSDSDDSTATLDYNQTCIHISRSADVDLYCH